VVAVLLIVGAIICKFFDFLLLTWTTFHSWLKIFFNTVAVYVETMVNWGLASKSMDNAHHNVKSIIYPTIPAYLYKSIISILHCVFN
jgi:hypothetical protein